MSQLFIGGLADRFGRRPVLLASLVLYAAACLAAIVATSILMLIVARIVQAAGATAGLALSRTVVRDLAPQDAAASMIGYVTMGMVVAPLFAPSIGGLIDDAFGWRMIFAFCLVLGLAAAVLAAMRLPETRPASISAQTTSQMLRRSWEVARDRRFLAYSLGGAFTTAVYLTFLGAAPYLVVETMGMSKVAYGLWFMALAGGYMIGNFCSGRFSERLGGKRMIDIGNALSIAGTAILFGFALVPVMHPAAIFLPSVLMSLGNGFLLPNRRGRRGQRRSQGRRRGVRRGRLHADGPRRGDELRRRRADDQLALADGGHDVRPHRGRLGGAGLGRRA